MLLPQGNALRVFGFGEEYAKARWREEWHEG
jgi:hypothetical protein